MSVVGVRSKSAKAPPTNRESAPPRSASRSVRSRRVCGNRHRAERHRCCAGRRDLTSIGGPHVVRARGEQDRTAELPGQEDKRHTCGDGSRKHHPGASPGPHGPHVRHRRIGQCQRNPVAELRGRRSDRPALPPDGRDTLLGAPQFCAPLAAGYMLVRHGPLGRVELAVRVCRGERFVYRTVHAFFALCARRRGPLPAASRRALEPLQSTYRSPSQGSRHSYIGSPPGDGPGTFARGGYCAGDRFGRPPAAENPAPREL